MLVPGSMRYVGIVIASLGTLACASDPPPAPAPPVAPPPQAKAPAPPPAPPAPPPGPGYPATRSEDVKDTIHGVVVADSYRWLEDVKSPEVQAWMKAEDQYTRERLARLPMRDALAARFRELYYLDSVSPPVHRGSRYFYRRTHKDKEKAILYWKEGDAGQEKVLLDPNGWSTDGSVSLGVTSVSHDGKWLAFTRKKNNSDHATCYVMDVATGKEHDVIEGCRYASPSWTPDGKGFYYTWLPTDAAIPASELPGYAEVRFHELGKDPKKDAIVHEKVGDPRKFISAGVSRDGRWLVLEIQHGWTSSDCWFRDLKDKKAVKAGTWTKLAVGEKALFNVAAWKNQLYVHTNADAPRWRVFKVDPKKPERGKWREIVAEDASAVLTSFAVVGGHLALDYLKNAATELRLATLDGKPVRAVTLPAIGTASAFIGNEDEDRAYFTFSTFTMPSQVFETGVKSGQTKLWAKVDVPADLSPYTVEQVFYPSKDGTKVSMFLVHRKDLQKNGDNPTLLYGYGGFNVSMTPSFASSLVPWLEKGGVYAVANLRGGGEYGGKWHEDGMLGKKQNVFDDMIAAAEWLIASGYTKPARLGVRGGSNGGLLMGAMTTQRPDLFGAVICGVPLLDMVRYHLFGSGKTWISEYGSAEDAEQFKALYAYSPYHHVKAGTKYPSFLMMAADSDDRVDPMHARKFTALLQSVSNTPDARPVWMRIEKNSGHGGADLVRQAVESSADAYAFLMAELGVK